MQMQDIFYILQISKHIYFVLYGRTYFWTRWTIIYFLARHIGQVIVLLA